MKMSGKSRRIVDPAEQAFVERLFDFGLFVNFPGFLTPDIGAKRPQPMSKLTIEGYPIAAPKSEP
jgi:hypothetical protein